MTSSLSRRLWAACSLPRRPHCPAYRLYRQGRAAAQFVSATGFPSQEPVLVPAPHIGLADERDALEVSPELRSLCQQQVSLLLSALHTSLLVAAAGGGAAAEQGEAGLSASFAGGSSSNGSSSSSSGRQEHIAGQAKGAGAGEGVVAVHGTTLSCAVYCRSAPSIQSGQLQLQLVAHSGPGGGGGPVGDSSSGVDQWGRQCLFLGRGELSLEDQEQWIVEQSIIVLPDSGGLVLPLAYNGFLMGLLVVERGGQEALDPGLSPLLQPPACTLFGQRDFQLLRQGASVLSMACAMDLRTSLERAGHAVKQRQVRGLVQQARKPLSTLRTLGAMLAPRLQEGEPDRDLAEGIMAQGDRLAELVSQLQGALHPPPSSPPPRLPALDPTPGNPLAGPGSSSSSAALPLQRRGGGAEQRDSPRLYPALPSSSIGSDSVVRTIDLDAGEWAPAAPGGGGSSSTAAAVARVMGHSGSPGAAPALPAAVAQPPSTPAFNDSASAGSAPQGAGAPASPAAEGTAASAAAGEGAGANFDGSSSSSGQSGSLWPARSAAGLGSDRPGFQDSQAVGPQPGSSELVMPEEQPATDLLNILMPLLSTAYIFCSANGIRFHMLPSEHAVQTGGQQVEQEGHRRGAASAGAGARTTGMLCVDVMVAPAPLKRMLSQLVDGIIACAARGDCVEVAMALQEWQEKAGVAITLGCLQDLGPQQQSDWELNAPTLLGFEQSPGPAGLPGRPALGGLGGLGVPVPVGRARRPEFAFLSSSARAAGGWFEVVENPRHVQHLGYGSVVAVLWLPVAEA